jgi:hypothetical protein
MKGFMQTCICHSRHPWQAARELGFWRFLGAVFITAGTTVSALGYPAFTILCLVIWSRASQDAADESWLIAWKIWSAELCILGFVGMMAPALLALRRRGLWHLLPWIPLLPFYYVLVSVAAWRGLWELLRAPSHWHKTRHGHARTSRTGRLQKHKARAATTISLNTTGP